MSDTPRTDAKEYAPPLQSLVDADFSRTLERENVKLKEENLVLKQDSYALTSFKCGYDDLKAENTRLKEEVERLKNEAIEIGEMAARRLERLTETEKMVGGLREGFDELLVALASHLTPEVGDALNKFATVLEVPQSIAQKFVSKEVLERLRLEITKLLQSSDVDWYIMNQGHDWKDAVDSINSLLGEIHRAELSSTEPREHNKNETT
jgi:soluble cytochrome b562